MSVTRSNRLRDRVHAELTTLCSTGGPLAEPPDGFATFFTDEVLREVVFEYREQRPDAPAEGHAVIVTAGPPGGGKSTQLEQVRADHRRIDPDEIKDLLLDRADAKGLLDARHGHSLSDGDSVALRELAGWVHTLSTDVADEVRRISLGYGENIVIEGTLWWSPLAERYPIELAENDYEHLMILDVEVPLATAVEQARRRWWSGRTGDDGRGGRFIADAAIGSFYDRGRPVSSCAVTARQLHTQAQEAGIETELLIVSRSEAGQEYGALLRAGGLDAAPGLGLAPSVPCLKCGRPLRSAGSIVRGYGPGCAARSG